MALYLSSVTSGMQVYLNYIRMGQYLHAAILSTGAQSQKVLMGHVHDKVWVFFFAFGSCFVQGK